jgi:hypothetical protein
MRLTQSSETGVNQGVTMSVFDDGWDIGPADDDLLRDTNQQIRLRSVPGLKLIDWNQANGCIHEGDYPDDEWDDGYRGG